MFKKLVSILLTITLFYNISAIAFAADSPYTVTKENIYGANRITIEYHTEDLHIKSVTTSGYRTTSVYTNDINEFDLYISEYSEMYEIDNNFTNENMIQNTLFSYVNDNHLGHFSNNDPLNGNIAVPYQYLVERYICEFKDSTYYFHYTDNQYVLQFNAETIGITTTNSYIVSHCTGFRDELIAYDNNIRKAFTDTLGFLPGTGTVVAIAQAYDSYVNSGLSGETLINSLAAVCSVVPGLSDITTVAALASHLGLAYANNQNAKTHFNTVKSYT